MLCKHARSAVSAGCQPSRLLVLQTDMGGSSAPRSTEDGVESIVAAAEGPRERKLSGGFWRDGHQISMEDGKPV